MRSTTTDTSSTAREAARRPDGRFGVQQLKEADTITLMPQPAGPVGTALELVRELELIYAPWSDALQCAKIITALDRDAQDSGYDGLSVEKLGLNATDDAESLARYEAVAFDDQEQVIGRFCVSGITFNAGTVPPTFATSAEDFDAGIDVPPVRGYDWDTSDFEYREAVVAAALGDEYRLGISMGW